MYFLSAVRALLEKLELEKHLITEVPCCARLDKPFHSFTVRLTTWEELGGQKIPQTEKIRLDDQIPDDMLETAYRQLRDLFLVARRKEQEAKWLRKIGIEED